VQVRELRKVIAKDAALAPNPYLKVTLSGCSVAEKWRGVDGKQTKQSQAYGEFLFVTFCSQSSLMSLTNESAD